ncbi:MAG: hypothetical protein Q4G34_00880 [Micrococcus sp.]|nr:hypothetical protein [Micrococcus sp.]
MRTTVNLPPALHRRAQDMAESRGMSLSATLAELVSRGLASTETPVELNTDHRTGLPVLTLRRGLTSADVAELVDEDTA